MKNLNISETLLKQKALKALLNSQPIDYAQVRTFVCAQMPQLIVSLIEDGLKYNLEKHFCASRATAKLSDETKQQIKNEVMKKDSIAKAKMVSTLKEVITDYTKLYDEWQATDGTPIYAMTRVQLLKNADQLEKSIDTTEKTILFYNELSYKMSANKPVRDCITPEEYQKIKKNVFGG